jgi:hypothetical protein
MYAHENKVFYRYLYIILSRYIIPTTVGITEMLALIFFDLIFVNDLLTIPNDDYQLIVMVGKRA